MSYDGKKKREDVLSSSLSYIQEPKTKVGKLRRKENIAYIEDSFLSDPSSFLQSSFNYPGKKLNLNDSDDIEQEDSVDEDEDDNSDNLSDKSYIDEDSHNFEITKTTKKIILSDSEFDSEKEESSCTNFEKDVSEFIVLNEEESTEIEKTKEKKRLTKSNRINLTTLNLETPFDGSTLSSVPPQDLPKIISQRLFPHQIKGLNWLLEKHRDSLGAILADDMGLGKVKL